MSQGGHLRIGRVLTHHRVHGGVFSMHIWGSGRMVGSGVVVEMIGKSVSHLFQVTFHRPDGLADQYQNYQSETKQLW